MSLLRKPFSRRWWLATLIVVAGIVFLIYLGLWQLDRMEERSAYNDLVLDRWNAAPALLEPQAVSDDLTELEYRRVQLDGRFDYDNQIVLTNQTANGQPGVQLITPMTLESGEHILVARGWIPYSVYTPDPSAKFREAEQASIVGLAQESQTVGGESVAVDGPQSEWYRVDIEAIEKQMPYDLLPFFVVQLPNAGSTAQASLGGAPSSLPVRVDRNPVLEMRSPTMHLSYALQWFTFALILGFGYLQFIRWSERRTERLANEQSARSTAVIGANP